MKRSFVCILSILAVALAMPLLAQTEKTVSGKVVSSSASQLVIQTDDGRQMTFNVDSQSTVPAGLRTDARVSVRYHELAGGTFHAATVTTMDTPAPRTDVSGDPARTTGTTTGTERTDRPAGTAATAQERTDRPADPATTEMERRELPATASPLPLVGLSGLLALAGGLGVRALRRRA